MWTEEEKKAYYKAYRKAHYKYSGKGIWYPLIKEDIDFIKEHSQDNENYMTMPQIADYLGCSKGTVTYHRVKLNLTFIKYGKNRVR